MPRWRQDAKTGKLIPIDEAAARKDGVSLHTAFESFVSPIDGSVISDRKQYREHCRKHNVVPTAEFSDEFFAKKQREREKLYMGKHTEKEVFARKQQIYNIMKRAEERGY